MKPSGLDSLRLLRSWGAVVLLATLAAAALAAPQAVESFDAEAWARLKQAKQATAVVFTTTDCSHCPAVVEQLARVIQPRRAVARLVTVVMDVPPGEADVQLLATAHYRQADRLLAFDGPAAGLRHQVNPAWRGVTPYVVLLRPGQPPRFVMGPPSAQDLKDWSGAR